MLRLSLEKVENNKNWKICGHKKKKKLNNFDRVRPTLQRIRNLERGRFAFLETKKWLSESEESTTKKLESFESFRPSADVETPLEKIDLETFFFPPISNFNFHLRFNFSADSALSSTLIFFPIVFKTSFEIIGNPNLRPWPSLQKKKKQKNKKRAEKIWASVVGVASENFPVFEQKSPWLRENRGEKNNIDRKLIAHCKSGVLKYGYIIFSFVNLSRMSPIELNK